MVVFRTSLSRSTSLPVLVAAFSLTACIPEGDVVEGTGGNTGAGTGGQTGSGGVTPGSGGNPGSGGTPLNGTGGSMAGTGGGTPGSGGAITSTGGSTGSGGRQGAGTGGASATGGRQGTGTGGMGGRVGSGGTVGTGGMGGRLGTGGAPAGGTTGNLPAGYAVCVPCHGADGAGVAAHGPEIQHPVTDFATWVIRNGRVHPDFAEPMPKLTVDLLTDAQLQGILTYLRAPPKPTTGQALFLDFCANCHGANAAGGVTTRPINTAPMTEFTTMVRGGHSAGQFAMRREYMPKWTTTELTDAELRLIFTHVEGL